MPNVNLAALSPRAKKSTFDPLVPVWYRVTTGIERQRRAKCAKLSSAKLYKQTQTFRYNTRYLDIIIQDILMLDPVINIGNVLQGIT